MSADETRETSVAAVALMLRAAAGAWLDRAGVGEQAASLGRALPPMSDAFDSAGWIGWCLAGLAVFEHGPPTSRIAVREAIRIVVVLAMLRTAGNVTHAARQLGTSRRTLRERLASFGCYPWSEFLASCESRPHAARPRSIEHGRERFLEPFRLVVPGEEPEVIEDGTTGVVVFKLEDSPLRCGPAWLGRGERTERLFRGLWVHRDTAEQYAREHGHDFRDDGL